MNLEDCALLYLVVQIFSYLKEVICFSVHAMHLACCILCSKRHDLFVAESVKGRNLLPCCCVVLVAVGNLLCLHCWYSFYHVTLFLLESVFEAKDDFFLSSIIISCSSFE